MKIKTSIADKYDGFIFDLDGTIYLEEQIIPKADEVINTLNRLNKKVVFLSNKTTGNSRDYYNFLCQSNINLQLDDVINATIIVKKYLHQYYNSKCFYAIAEKKFIKEIENSGLKYTRDPNEIDIVLVTLDRTLNYKKLEIAASALDNGAHFFAANIDNTCPVECGEILDAGSTISALEKRTNRKLEKHFGKPSKYILDAALKRLKISSDKCLIVGDRLETDIAMGNLFNIDTALVTTGVSNQVNQNMKYNPTFKIKSVADLL